MTQQEKFLLEQKFDAYSNTFLRITVQNTINYHNAEDVVQGVVRFTINFCCNLNCFTVIRRRVSLHIYSRVAGAYTKAARVETRRGLPFLLRKNVNRQDCRGNGENFQNGRLRPALCPQNAKFIT